MSSPTSTSPRGSFEEEGAPLLSPTAAVEDSISSATPSLQPKKHKPWILLCALIFVLVAIIDIGAFLSEAPKTRVYEANICVHYYEEKDASKILPDGTVPEELCKEDAIQQKMAMIFGWQDLFDAIPGMLLAVPFGTLADKYGRKWIFAMSLMGLQLNCAWVLLICWFRTLPLQLTWFSAAFYIIGGGPIVATAIAVTMVSDIVPPDKRTTIFLYLTASVLIAEMIAPIIGARLMDHGDWLPLLLALAIQQTGIMMAAFFPETLHLRDLPEPKDMDGVSEMESRDSDNESLFSVNGQLRHFKDAVVFLRRDFTLALVISTFFSSRLGRQALVMLIRYATKRYHWPIQKASYLLSFRAATNLVALTIFVPIFTIILVKVLRMPTHYADVWLSRGSIALTAFSFLIIGMAAYPAILIVGLLVFNLGTGYNAAMRSTAVHLVGGASSPDVGRLFAVIAIMEAFGTMLAGPLLAGLFEWGIHKGEPWIGLPYIITAIVFAGITVLTFMIPVKDKVIVYAEVDDSDSESGARTPRRHQD